MIETVPIVFPYTHKRSDYTHPHFFLLFKSYYLNCSPLEIKQKNKKGRGEMLKKKSRLKKCLILNKTFITIYVSRTKSVRYKQHKGMSELTSRLVRGSLATLTSSGRL